MLPRGSVAAARRRPPRPAAGRDPVSPPDPPRARSTPGQQSRSARVFGLDEGQALLLSHRRRAWLWTYASRWLRFAVPPGWWSPERPATGHSTASGAGRSARRLSATGAHHLRFAPHQARPGGPGEALAWWGGLVSRTLSLRSALRALGLPGGALVTHFGDPVQGGPVRVGPVLPDQCAEPDPP